LAKLGLSFFRTAYRGYLHLGVFQFPNINQKMEQAALWSSSYVDEPYQIGSVCPDLAFGTMSQLVQNSFIAQPRAALRAIDAAIDWSLTSPPISGESTNPILHRQDVDTHTYAMLPKIQSTHNVVHAPGEHSGQPILARHCETRASFRWRGAPFTLVVTCIRMNRLRHTQFRQSAKAGFNGGERDAMI